MLPCGAIERWYGVIVGIFLYHDSLIISFPFSPMQPWNPRRHRTFSAECHLTLRALAMGIMRLKRAGATAAAIGGAAAAAAPAGLPPVLPPLVHVDPACIEWMLEGVTRWQWAGFWD
jgi:hypothetical protein